MFIRQNQFSNRYFGITQLIKKWHHKWYHYGWHGISKVHYISVNKSNYQWENARLMRQNSIINNITPLAHGDKICR